MKPLLFSFVMLMALFCHGQPSDIPGLSAYIMNPGMTGEGQQPAHTPLVVFDNITDALTGSREKSSWHQSLNGTWRFRWDKNSFEAPAGFFDPSFDYSSWDGIEVPGTWQMQGYGHSLYRNIPLEFSPYDPPNVPLDFNPTASYIRTFDIPDRWDGKRVFLHFEGVKTCFWVWINGHYAGFNKGAMTSAEFDITGYVSAGTNHIAVRVMRWADATYLENQDMWKFHGIYRSVYLFATPEVHLRDFQVTTIFDDSYSDATLSIRANMKNFGNQAARNATVQAHLYDAGNNTITTITGRLANLAPDEEQTLNLSAKISQPLQWSAEKPNLYTLIFELPDANGKAAGFIEHKVGFRQIEIEDGVLMVNGVPVKLKGVNRHEHSPYTGRTLTSAEVEAELILMKKLNINAIRTSHYPNMPAFYQLTDRYGFYVCDEVNAECHQGERFLAHVPGWETSLMDRMEKMVQRDKNHPSIIMWSTGNECGLAPVHRDMAELARRIDPTRVITHQSNHPNGDAPFADILGTRYPTPAQLVAIGDTTQRPVVMGEYSHAMGNAMGHFDEYWEIIHSNPRLQGGFIWDWMDQGVLFDLVTTPDLSTYDHQAVLMGRPEIVDGKDGSGLAFSGLDDFIELTPSPWLDLQDQFTIETWIYPHGFLNQNNIIGKGYAIDLAQTDPHTLRLAIRTSGQQAHTLEAALPANWNFNWHHIAATFNGDHVALFINGKEAARKPVTGSLARDRSPLTIGKNHIVNNEAWAGYISNSVVDDIRIHNIARPAGQLGAYIPEPPRDSHLVLWLPLERTDTSGTFYSYGSTPVSGSGAMNGIIAFNRKPEPEAWQAKHSHAPVHFEAIEATRGIFRVHNRHHFTLLSELETRWALMENGKAIRSGTLHPEAGPGEATTLEIPIQAVTMNKAKYYNLIISSHLKEATPWADEGFEIAFGDFSLQEPDIQKLFSEEATKHNSPLQFFDDGNSLIITGQDFEYSFDNTTATVRSVNIDGEPLLVGGPELKVTRAPIMNELSWWGVAEFDLLYRYGLDALTHRLINREVLTVTDSLVKVSYRVRSTASESADIFFVNDFVYSVFWDGLLQLDHTVQPNVEIPGWPRSHVEWLQKIGLAWELPAEATTLEWLGKGPFETYPDRKTGAKTGLYRTELSDISMPYIIPQDFDNRADVRWAVIYNQSGTGLAIYSDQLFNVAIDPYENLESAWYPYQLKRKTHPTINIDHQVTGVGGTSVTAREAYRTYPVPRKYSLFFRPLRTE